MAEALARRRLSDCGLGDLVSVGSAGLLGGGASATRAAVEAVSSYGIDISTHRSRLLTADVVSEADLILGMTREHVREAALLRQDGINGVFTMRELERRALETGSRTPGEALPAYLGRLGAGRSARALLGESESDDVADPVGRPLSEHRATAAELDRLVGVTIRALWGSL